MSNANSLFDYDTEEYHTNNFSINKNSIIWKNQDKVYHQIIKENNFPEIFPNNKSEFIAKITPLDDCFAIDLKNEFNFTDIKEGELKNKEEKPWMIIRHTYSRDKIGYKLKEGDFIRLGKVVFKIKEIQIEAPEKSEFFPNKEKTLAENFFNRTENNLNLLQLNDVSNQGANILSINNNYPIVNSLLQKNHSSGKGINNQQSASPSLIGGETQKRKNKRPICRICLSDDHEPENPLINPCSCLGTVKYIHLFCVRQ